MELFHPEFSHEISAFQSENYIFPVGKSSSPQLDNYTDLYITCQEIVQNDFPNPDTIGGYITHSIHQWGTGCPPIEATILRQLVEDLGVFGERAKQRIYRCCHIEGKTPIIPFCTESMGKYKGFWGRTEIYEIYRLDLDYPNSPKNDVPPVRVEVEPPMKVQVDPSTEESLDDIFDLSHAKEPKHVGSSIFPHAKQQQP
jgi:hypothetical protein